MRVFSISGATSVITAGQAVQQLQQRNVQPTLHFGNGEPEAPEKPKLRGGRRVAELFGAFLTWTGASFAAHTVSNFFNTVIDSASQTLGRGKGSVATAAVALVLSGIGFLIQRKVNPA